MTYGDMQELTKPFRPFLLETTGETFEVRRQEGFLLTTNYIVIGLLPPTPQQPQDFNRVAIVDLEHAVKIEPLPIPVAQKGNGQST